MGRQMATGHHGMKQSTFALLLLMSLAYGTYGVSLFSHDFTRDDEPIILDNDLLRNWSTLPTLMMTGYWQASRGNGSPVHEYRPFLMLSYFMNEHTF